jgi:multidrug resistance efflux pump
MANDEAFAESSRILNVAGRIIGLLIVVSAIVVGLYVLRLYYIYPRTDDAYVRANVVGIAPHVSGPIVELPIHDNQHVAKGALLFVVDPRPYQSTLDAAVAKLQLTELNIKALEDAIRTAKSDQVRLEADAAYDKQYVGRIKPLLAASSSRLTTSLEAESCARRPSCSWRASSPAKRRTTSPASPATSTRAAAPQRRALRRRARPELLLCGARAVRRLRDQPSPTSPPGSTRTSVEVFALVDDRKWYVIANFRDLLSPGSLRPGWKPTST